MLDDLLRDGVVIQGYTFSKKRDLVLFPQSLSDMDGDYYINRILDLYVVRGEDASHSMRRDNSHSCQYKINTFYYNTKNDESLLITSINYI